MFLSHLSSAALKQAPAAEEGERDGLRLDGAWPGSGIAGTS